MKEDNLRRFTQVFKNLDPNDRLEVANAIVESLHLSDSLLREDGYDRDLSGLVMPILENYISTGNNQIKLNRIKQLVERFNKLPLEHQSNVIEALEESIGEKLTQEELFYGYQICQKEGHTFGPWNENIIERPEFDEAGWCFYKEKYLVYNRICKRCGKEEIRTNK